MLALLVSCLSFGPDTARLQIRALAGKSPAEQMRLLHEWQSKGELEPEVSAEVRELDNLWLQDASGLAATAKLARILDLLKLQSRVHLDIPFDPVARAKAIKRSPLYRDPGLREQANWLSGAAERLNRIRAPECRNSRVPSGNLAGAGEALKIVMWALLAAFVIAFSYFAVSRFSWSRKLQRRAKAMMEDDEPERTVDEWLERADQLDREGRFRDAIRCLYLACLLRIDEARVARFERGETNWEHLARIEASPNRPRDLEFREPTKAFDRAWYGMQEQRSEDVAQFRHWYRRVTELTRIKAA